MPGYRWLPHRLKVQAQASRGRRDRLRPCPNVPGLDVLSSAAGSATDEIMAASELCNLLIRWLEVRRPGRPISNRNRLEVVGAPGGAIMCDDIHEARIGRLAPSALRRSGYSAWSSREETLDSIGRFALVATRPFRRA
jgi:hypothetical protein